MRCHLDFSEILRVLKASPGTQARRAGWGSVITVAYPDEEKFSYLKMIPDEGRPRNWEPDQADLFATDWMVL